MSSPPIVFPGAAWRAVGVHRRYGDALPLHVLDGPPAGYAIAYRVMRERLVSQGFSWTEIGSPSGHAGPCWWAHPAAPVVDLAALQADVDAVIAADAAERAERDAARERAVEREIEETSISSAPIRRELAAVVADAPWQLGRLHADAVELLASPRWRAWAADRARNLLAGARANRERAERRLGRPGPVTWSGRATDPAVREAALEGCRALSELDADWAAVRNGRGCSQATTWTGHVLSERESLDEGAAAHALAILHGHRGQLPGPLRTRLFGAADLADEAPRLL